MKLKEVSILWFLIILLLWQIEAKLVQDESCGEPVLIKGTKIDGIPVGHRTKWPWLVALFKLSSNEYFCSGSLITKRHLLVAAHCFQHKGQNKTIPPEHVTVRLAKYDLNILNEILSKSIGVSEIIVHPDWKVKILNYDADISVVIMSEEVEFDSFIRPVCLPPQSNVDVTGIGTIAGWGNDIKSRKATHIEFKTSILTDESCFKAFPELSSYSSNRTFCGSSDKLADSSAGFYESNSSPFIIKGITTHQHKRISAKKISLYTNVGSYVEWIEAVINGTKEIE